MNKVIFYLIEQIGLQEPTMTAFITMSELFKYIKENNLNIQNIKLVSTNVYFYTPTPDEHVEIRYHNKVKKKKEQD